ncbi:MAG: hypothetical protein HYR60_30525 [Acidobacteria bacterium]|nr:hypothetical protein [Acidobacteriota bacterium]
MQIAATLARSSFSNFLPPASKPLLKPAKPVTYSMKAVAAQMVALSRLNAPSALAGALERREKLTTVLEYANQNGFSASEIDQLKQMLTNPLDPAADSKLEMARILTKQPHSGGLKAFLALDKLSQANPNRLPLGLVSALSLSTGLGLLTFDSAMATSGALVKMFEEPYQRFKTAWSSLRSPAAEEDLMARLSQNAHGFDIPLVSYQNMLMDQVLRGFANQ